MKTSSSCMWSPRNSCRIILRLLSVFAITCCCFGVADVSVFSETQEDLPPSLNRTSFVRTDDTPQAVAYDPVHRLIFASAPHLNCVDVISLATQRVIKCIPVSGASGLSLSADGTEVLATQLGVVAWIDTTSLDVVRRDIISQLVNSPFGSAAAYVSADQAYQAANGKVLLISGRRFGNGNFNTVDAIEWDPIAATSVLRTTDSGGGGVISATSDHSKLLFAGGGQVTVYDSTTDQFTPVPGIGFQDAVINPMGSQIAVVGGTPFVRFFNLQMQQVGSTDVPTCCGFQFTPPMGVYSADGKYLYLTYLSQFGYLPILLTIDANSFQIVGSASAYSTGGLLGFIGIPEAADSTGLVFEIADHGVAINDAASVHDFTNAAAIGGFFAAVPAEGPLNTATVTQFENLFPSLPEIFFGDQQGQVSAQPGSASISATAPPSSVPGPVNVMAIEPNGVAAFMPQGFTYGSLPIQYGDLASGPEGGVLADVFGYGFSADIQGASIEVTIGHSQATVQTQTLFPYPFPLQHLVVKVPAGAPGGHDIRVESLTGTATFHRAFHYLRSVVDYPSGDSLQFVLYDSHRNQLYLSAVDHIDVFSLSTHAFAAPIAVPSQGGVKHILGLALTPDGSKLLAANKDDQSMAIINPDNPNSGAVTVGLPLAGMQGNPGPFEIATTNTNQAFVTVTVGNVLSGGVSDIYVIDLGSLRVSTANVPFGSLNLNNNYIQGSLDGTTVVEATSNTDAGPIMSWQAASNTWQVHWLGGLLETTATVSGDGNVLAIGTFGGSFLGTYPRTLDAHLNLTAHVDFPDFAAIQEGPTLQLDQSGALLYAVNGTGVDILDARTGQLRERVVLSEQILGGPTEVLQTAVKVMDITPAGNKIFLLTTAGLTVVELDSVPLGIGSISPGSGPAGTVVTLRGSGLTRETSVRVNGIEAAVSFLDPSTMRVTIPESVHAGAAQFTLRNPEHSKYSLDAAFLVQ